MTSRSTGSNVRDVEFIAAIKLSLLNCFLQLRQRVIQFVGPSPFVILVATKLRFSVWAATATEYKVFSSTIEDILKRQKTNYINYLTPV
eukprot:snap_masked-scaffold_29-processed-gene-0.20-mRNA-1 protein AED:1.00 eAED:1.00 QI:0/0/0/0/1/1/2/0/88